MGGSLAFCPPDRNRRAARRADAQTAAGDVRQRRQTGRSSCSLFSGGAVSKGVGGDASAKAPSSRGLESPAGSRRSSASYGGSQRERPVGAESAQRAAASDGKA